MFKIPSLSASYHQHLDDVAELAALDEKHYRRGEHYVDNDDAIRHRRLNRKVRKYGRSLRYKIMRAILGD